VELLIALFSGFVAAALAPWLHRLLGERMAYLAALVPLGVTLYFGQRLGTPGAEQATAARYDWVPELGLSLSLYLDGLSLLFVLLIAGVGALVLLYSRAYMAGRPDFGVFFAYMLGFMASMIGLVLAGNLLTLYVFWELTTLASFILIGFEHERQEARRAALQSLLVTAVGGLAMLAGLILLGIAGGSFEVAQLLSRGDAVREHSLYPAILALILIGAFTKSAQFPFHFWLPNAMEAPTPVSTYLHSATMVKAGVYLLARLLPVLGETVEWHVTVTTVGATTMFVGALMAYWHHELKAVLAYLTINVLGTLVMLLGLGTRLAVKAALVYILAHGLYKGALFLMAGAVHHQTHTLDVRRLGGLWRRMPVTFGAALLAALSMAGLIPLFGFVSKELYLEAVWKAPSAAAALTAVSVAASMLLVAGAGIVGLLPFVGPPAEPARGAREAGFLLLFSPVLLAVAGVAAGLYPQVLATPLVERGLGSVLREPASVKLALWHGLTVPLGLSAAALLAGAALYVVRGPALRWTSALAPLKHWGPEAWYERSLGALQWAAAKQTRLLQSGYLRLYVLTVLAATVGLVGAMLVRMGLPRLAQPSINVRFSEGVAAVLIVVAALATVRSRGRYRAVAALGVVGFSMSWMFALFGAPDLAMTQIAVETLTVLLFVLAFRGLPEFKDLSPAGTRIRDALLAGCAGAMMTLLVLLVIEPPGPSPVSEYYAQHSYTLAHGRNVVNTILVDFRALDTLGEVTVLATAALGVYALLRLVLREGRAR